MTLWGFLFCFRVLFILSWWRMGEIEGTYRVLQTPGTRLGAQTPGGVSTLEPGQNLLATAARASARTQEKHLHLRVKLLDNSMEIFDIEVSSDIWRHISLYFLKVKYDEPHSILLIRLGLFIKLTKGGVGNTKILGNSESEFLLLFEEWYSPVFPLKFWYNMALLFFREAGWLLWSMDWTHPDLPTVCQLLSETWRWL